MSRMIPAEFSSATLALKQKFLAGAQPPPISDAEIGDTIADTDKWLDTNLPLLRMALCAPAQKELTHRQIVQAVHIVTGYLLERA